MPIDTLTLDMFGKVDTRPVGFAYRSEFISTDEERELLGEIAGLDFAEVRMHGVVARRRIVQLGCLYSFDSYQLTAGPAIPTFLEPLRARAASLIGRSPDELAEALITEYTPRASIGWHRDAPVFGVVVAVSLAGPCQLRFRRGPGTRAISLDVAPRSVYVLDGPARSRWQHSVPPTKNLRYSITFRTLRTQVRG